MATRLIQVVPFPNVAAGGTVVLPHSINVNGLAQAPDFVAQDAASFTVVVNSATVTVTNNGGAVASVNVWLELKHTIQRAFGANQTTSLVPRPFVASGGSGGLARFPVHSPVFVASFTALVNLVNIATIPGVNAVATMPLASSVPNGTWLVIKTSHTNNADITVTPQGGDTIDGQATGDIDGQDLAAFYVSDGISNWVNIADAQP